MSKNRNFPTENTAAAFLYGRHPVIAAIANPQRIINSIFCTKENTEELKNACAKARRSPEIVKTADRKEIERLLPRDAVHQGIAPASSRCRNIRLKKYAISPPPEKTAAS